MKAKASPITPDKRNYRKHGDKNKSLIKKSLEECGAGRSILIDKAGSIIAGNGVFEQAQMLGIPIKVVETDGKELIAVKRNDISTKDPKRKKLAVMDNTTSDSSEFDMVLLPDDFSPEVAQDLGIAMFDEMDEDGVAGFFGSAGDGMAAKKEKTVKCPNCGEEFSA